MVLTVLKWALIVVLLLFGLGYLADGKSALGSAVLSIAGALYAKSVVYSAIDVLAIRIVDEIEKRKKRD
jgi:hypothetical protein